MHLIDRGPTPTQTAPPVDSHKGAKWNIGVAIAAILFCDLLFAAAQAKESARFPNVVLPRSNNSPVTVRAQIYRPRGNESFPAVIVLHGCGGHDAHHERWAERLVSWGYVAVVIDSLDLAVSVTFAKKLPRLPPRCEYQTFMEPPNICVSCLILRMIRLCASRSTLLSVL